jgi:predicted DNA-binding WGR domain protein
MSQETSQINPVEGEVFIDDDNVAYSAKLHQTDISEKNNNKFYSIQLIKTDEGDFKVFKHWGRFGYAGNKDSESFNDLSKAKKEFEKLFKEKTKNIWKAGSFVPYPGKYFMLTKDSHNEARVVLEELRNLVQTGADNDQLLSASNRFYSLVPHDSRKNRLPVIDSIAMIQEKLDNLIQ